MININSLLKKINIYKFIFYTLIYKYYFCYIIFILFLYGLVNNEIDLCCGKAESNIYYLISAISFCNLWIIPILTFINILLISINIYTFNKNRGNYENNSNENYNRIKYINKYEFYLIIFYFISFFIIFIDLKYNYRDLSLYILTVILGLFPISTLELLYFFENKKPLT